MDSTVIVGEADTGRRFVFNGNITATYIHYTAKVHVVTGKVEFNCIVNRSGSFITWLGKEQIVI